MKRDLELFRELLLLIERIEPNPDKMWHILSVAGFK